VRLCRLLCVVLVVSGLGPLPARAQQTDQTTVLDSVAVVGANRTGVNYVLSQIRIPVGQPINYRDVQRAIEALYATGQYDSVHVDQGTSPEGKEILRFSLTERPLLVRWGVAGTKALPNRSVRSKVKLVSGRPFNPEDVQSSIASIDSLYEREGYYQTGVNVVRTPQDNGMVEVWFNVIEGPRVAISQVIIEGNEVFSDADIVDHMNNDPEGFFWFRKGEYDEDELTRDVRERLPAFYASNGYLDFQVLRDTLVINREMGKATLILTVDEGAKYYVGTFESIGNRQFTDAQIRRYYPFDRQESGGGFLGLGGGGGPEGPIVFDRSQWDEAIQNVSSLYYNNGYISARVESNINRRTESDGTRRVDLRMSIFEGSPAIVRQIQIKGNTITHESVIRRAILMIPGDVFRQDMMVRSYQNISNLGFFEQPLPVPQVIPVNQQGDVDIIFTVDERRTGNINFGASVGQGTGVGGFIGLDEPNFLGRGKRVSFQWQFGQNINDFNVTYSDPAIRGSLISGTLSLHRTRQRFTVADLGRITSRGGSIQFGFPLLGSRFTRILTSYTLEQSDYDTPAEFARRYHCTNCILSSIAVAIVRDTRIGLPFATAGTMHKFELATTGGFLGGSGDFRRATFEGRWYAPLNPSTEPGVGGVQFVAGFTARTGFVWGDVGPHFQQLFAMGGTQFGIQLRGYDEFSITPAGFDPTASGLRVNTVDAFGATYMSLTPELGLRLSQALYMDVFMDAGNVWAQPREFNPTRMYRGAGFGINLLSPLGPIGLDYAYGFDRVDAFGNPDPGWKLHFKIGNFF
jgi:outer membrane protein insertion porin family